MIFEGQATSSAESGNVSGWSYVGRIMLLLLLLHSTL